jgi:hypothetical protein
MHIRSCSENSVFGVKGSTPLIKFMKYPDGCLKDYMHLILLGATKFFCRQWFEARFESRNRVIFGIRKYIPSIQLIINNIKFPSNVHRKNLILNEYSKWKASEYRLFLLYVCPVVIIKFMSTEVAYNFLAFALGKHIFIFNFFTNLEKFNFKPSNDYI